MSKLKAQHQSIWEGLKARSAPIVRPVPTDRYKSKLERDYARTYLDPLVHSGAVRSYHFEALKFRLGDGASFCPDFYVVLPDDVHEIHEIKGGFCREAALVRFKVARGLYPSFTWKMIVRKGGQFVEKKV